MQEEECSVSCQANFAAVAHEGKCLQWLHVCTMLDSRRILKGLTDDAEATSRERMENNVSQPSTCREDCRMLSCTCQHDLTWSSESMSSCSSASGGSLLPAGFLCRCPAWQRRKRLAADTFAQCTAALKAPGPFSFSSEPAQEPSLSICKCRPQASQQKQGSIARLSLCSSDKRAMSTVSSRAATS